MACEVIKNPDSNNIYHAGIMIPEVYLNKEIDMVSVQTTLYGKHLYFCNNPRLSYSFTLNSSNTPRCAT